MFGGRTTTGNARTTGTETTSSRTITLPDREVRPYALSGGSRLGASLEGIEYASSIFERATIERYLGYFRTLLEATVAERYPDSRSSASFLPPSGISCSTDGMTPKPSSPRQLCASVVRAAGTEKSEATASSSRMPRSADEELNRRANQLAHHLRDLGVGPDARVAICMERGFDMIRCSTRCAQAGEPTCRSIPLIRLNGFRFMMDDAERSLCLPRTICGSSSRRLPGVCCHRLDAPTWEGCPDSNPIPTVSDSQPAISHCHLYLRLYGESKGRHGRAPRRGSARKRSRLRQIL